MKSVKNYKVGKWEEKFKMCKKLRYLRRKAEKANGKFKYLKKVYRNC